MVEAVTSGVRRVPQQRLFERQMDRKGRVALPSPIRQLFGERVVVTLGVRPDGLVLLLATPERWAELEAARGSRWDWWVLHGSTAAECEIQPETGRVLLPIELREAVGLQPANPVVVRWMGSAVEVLPVERFRAEIVQLLRRRPVRGICRGVRR